MNKHGEVAFVGTLPSAAIYNGPGSEDTVIQIGDALDGSFVESLSVRQMNGHFFNDHGQVAFMAVLANGNTGFYRADPDGLEIPRPFNPAIYKLLVLNE